MTKDRTDFLKRQIAEAAARVAAHEATVDHDGPATPGDVFILGSGSTAFEYLFVREHPDDPETVLLVPVSDFPLAGSCDVLVMGDVGSPIEARCDVAFWHRRDACRADLRMATVTPEALSRVRFKMNALARGNVKSTPEALAVDSDPAYEGHLRWLRTATMTINENHG